MPHYLVALLKCGNTYFMSGNYWLVIALTALIPMLIGFLWYSKALFGNSWMRANRFHPEDMKGGNMVMILGLTYVFSLMLATILSAIVIHQAALHSIIANDKTDAAKAWLENSMNLYGRNFRTFRHGAFHGVITSLFIALPIIGIISVFEKRSWKYVLIHVGFWLVSLALMGGVICQWA